MVTGDLMISILNQHVLGIDFCSHFCNLTRFHSFALMCKVGRPRLSDGGRSVTLQEPDLLERATIRIAEFLLTFFINTESRIIRPYTNSNFILDFYRYTQSEYYTAFVKYLRHKRVKVPDYDKQYEGITMFYSFVKNLHGYDKFVLEGATSSTPNSKSLQYVLSTEGAARKLARGDYYKYRAANLMFGCNAGAMYGICSFSEFNAWRKNQLLSFYEVMKGRIGGLAEKISRGQLSKYRDYCKLNSMMCVMSDLSHSTLTVLALAFLSQTLCHNLRWASRN